TVACAPSRPHSRVAQRHIVACWVRLPGVRRTVEGRHSRQSPLPPPYHPLPRASALPGAVGARYRVPRWALVASTHGRRRPWVTLGGGGQSPPHPGAQPGPGGSGPRSRPLPMSFGGSASPCPDPKNELSPRLSASPTTSRSVRQVSACD